MGAGLYIHTYTAQADFIAEILLLQSAAVTAAITGMYQYARTEVQFLQFWRIRFS